MKRFHESRNNYKKAVQEIEDKIKAWRNCEGNYHTLPMGALLRVNGDMVESSNGMRVKLRECRLMLKAWASHPQNVNGKSIYFSRRLCAFCSDESRVIRGEHGERFTVTAVAGGLIVGCHTFTNKELNLFIERIS